MKGNSKIVENAKLLRLSTWMLVTRLNNSGFDISKVFKNDRAGTETVLDTI